MQDNMGRHMRNGCMGKVLWIDLSNNAIREEIIPVDIYRTYLSGIGMAVRLLYDRIPPDVDPLGPDNIMGFVAGLLTGTGSLFAGRWMVVAKSPLTGTWGDANCGGNFAPAIKRCGYDGIFFSGISERPVYLCIDKGQTKLRDACDLWGMDTKETEETLKKETGSKNVRIACIGPAGENLSLISGIANDGGRMAARSGLGAESFPLFEWLNAATGWEKTPEEYMQIGERIQTLKQMFNIKQGIEPSQVKMSDRALGRPPMISGANRGRTIPIEKLVRDYWEVFGWDPQTGKPTRTNQKRLKLISP